MTDYEPRYSVWALIEGVGPALTDAQALTLGNDDRYRFSAVQPAFAALAPAGVWVEALFSLPDLLSERLAPLGGVAELGGISLELVDIDDLLTANIAPDVRPVTRLVGDLNDSGSPIVLSIAGLAEDDIIYVGPEAMVLTAAPASTTLTARRRAALGTLNVGHRDGDLVYLKSPFIGGRRIDVYVAPEESASQDAATLAGSYRIEGASLDPSTNVWTFTGKSYQRGVDAAAPSAPSSFEVVGVPASVADGGTGTISTVATDEANVSNQYALDASTFARAYVLINDEVVGGAVNADGSFTILFRGVAGTKVDDIEPGDIGRQVFVASPLGSSFRVDDAATAHPLRILLNILLSRTGRDDGTPDFNAVSGEGTYDNLPDGYGGGVPATNIDWASWRDIIDRTADFELPNLVYGGGDETTIGEWADEQILKPLGVSLVFQNDKVYAIRPRLPLVGEEVDTITLDDIHVTGQGGELLPDWKPTRDFANAPTTFAFLIGPQEVGAVARATRGGLNDGTEEIEVSGARSIGNTFWTGEAISRVRQIYKPRTLVTVNLNARTLPLLLGSVVRFTVAQLPNFAGARGVDSLAQIVEREVKPSVDEPLQIQAVLDLFAPTQEQRRVAPSGFVTGVSTNTATLEANRYTRSDQLGTGLPETDAAAFAVGDVVRLMDEGGLELAGGATQTVSSISGNAVTLNGNFGGALAANTILTTADYDDCTSTQQGRYTFQAGDDFAVDASDAAGMVYGDE